MKEQRKKFISRNARSQKLAPVPLDLSIAMLGIRFEAPEVTAQAIRAMVFEARGDGLPDFLRDFASMFPQVWLRSERSILEIITNGVNAWNSYPHEVIPVPSPIDFPPLLNRNKNDSII